MEKKSSQTAASTTTQKTDKKGGQGQSVRWKAWWRQGNIKCVVSEEYASCWVHQDCHVADEPKSSVEESGRSIRKKRRMSSAIERDRTRLLDGHRDRHAQRLWVLGPSNGRKRTQEKGGGKKGKKGAGYNNLRKKTAFNKVTRVSGGRDKCQVRLKGGEHDYWMDTAIRMLGGYGFQGKVMADDGSDKRGKMGAAYNNLRWKKKKHQCKVGREWKGSRSIQHESAAFLLALRDTLIEEPMLYLFENQSLLKAVNRWICQVENQHWWGRLTRIFWAQPSRFCERGLQWEQQFSFSGNKHFLGQSASASRRTSKWATPADILVDKAISDPKVGKEWCQRTNRAVFTWKQSCREAGK